MRWQRRLHRGARLLGWVAGCSLIVLAVLVGVAQLSLPLLARHPQWVAAQLSERLHRPISFASMEGHWRPAGPLFVLHDITVQPTEGGVPLRVPQAALSLDLGAFALPSRHLLNLHLSGMRLDLTRDADGTWHVNGFGVGGDGGNQNASFGNLSVDLWLSNSRLDITDAGAGRHYAVVADELRLSRQGDRVRVGGSLHREGATGVLHGAGSFRQDGADGRLWIEGSGLDLPGLLSDIDLHGYAAQAGRGSVALWLDWRKGKVVRSLVRADLRDLAVINPDGNRAQVTALHGLAEVRIDNGDYRLRWGGDDGSGLAAMVRQPGSDAMRVDAVARNLALDPLLPWLALKPQLSAGLAQWIGTGQPHGVLTQADLHWSQAAGLESAQIGFRGLGIEALGKLPGVDHLDGNFRADAEAFSIELPSQAATLRFPGVFPQPFVMSQLGGEVAMWHDAQDQAWHIGTDRLAFEGAGYGGEARGEVALPDAGGRPFLDLYATVNHAEVTAAKLFWPNSMPPPSVEWLNRALVSGKVDQGDVLVRGDLRDWPFRHNEGRFEAHAVVSDVVFDYGKDWPRAEGVHATADFIDGGMLVQADAGQSMGFKADKAVASIPDFADTTLDLTVQGSGSGADAMNFVAHSPIASKQADVLAKLNLGGDVAANFHLVLPVKDISHFTLDGSAQLKNSYLRAPDWNLALEQLGGPLRFDAHGLQAGPLQAVAHGRPTTLNLSIAGATGDPAKILAAQLHGNFSVAELVDGFPSLKWLGPTAQGRSDFTIGFEIAHPGGDAAGSAPLTQVLSIDSALNGMSLELPAPLHKPAADSLPLHLSMNLPVANSDVQISLGGLARARLRLAGNANQPFAASAAFGTDMPDAAPAKGIRVRGRAALLDVTGWVQQTAGGAGGGDGPGLESIDVSADQAQLFGHNFANMSLQVTPQPGALSVVVDSAAVAGQLSVPTEDLRKRGITAHLQRLYWPKDTPPAGQEPAGAPVVAAAAPVLPPPNPAATGIDPASLPPFHMSVNDLRLGQAKLGEARLETWPTAQGMHLDQLRSHSRSVQISAGGDWNGSAENSRTHLEVDFSAENLGKMLTALGYAGIVEGGKTQVSINAGWPGAPSSIDWANMDGTLRANVSNGRILDVAPGVGRLFGLVSLAELPRRLTLDFGDVFGKGLAFDSINGNFRLAAGMATTDNLKIRGPAADIDISGRTGLRARDYDQQVSVVPHIGNSLPVVGAVAGPIGIAAGLAVQGLLGRVLNKAAVRRYRITGSWDKPVMTPLDKAEPAAASTAALPEPAAAGSAAR